MGILRSIIKIKEMKIKSINIKEAVRMIQDNELFLPPIQRDLVWDKGRMENLFDSLFRGFPINNFVFWQMVPATTKNYPLRQFPKNHYQKLLNKKEEAPRNLNKTVWSVIDGQQRLSSIYLGLAGIYYYKNSKKRNLKANHIASYLYFNILTNAQKDLDANNPFGYWSIADAEIMENDDLCFEVSRVLQWGDAKKEALVVYTEFINRAEKENRKSILKALENKKDLVISNLLRIHKLVNDYTINYLEIEEQNLDTVVEIFTRINSGGMVLKKSDLLFSTLVASWIEGESEINELESALHESGLKVSKDFIMKACITLCDLPVKYKLESFKRKNCLIIKQNWDSIKNALLTLAELLPKINFAYKKSFAENALIPIAYYIKNGGNIRQSKAINELRLFYVISQLNGIFGGQGDAVIEKIRSIIKGQTVFDFSTLLGIKLPGQKSFVIDSDRLKKIIEDATYGSQTAYLVLSLLYDSIDLKSQNYEVDHLHPKSRFNENNLRKNGVKDKYVIESWIYDKKDSLGNLQLMSEIENNAKKNKPLIEHLKAIPSAQRKKILQENILPDWSSNSELELINFEVFLANRTKKIEKILKRKLKVK